MDVQQNDDGEFSVDINFETISSILDESLETPRSYNDINVPLGRSSSSTKSRTETIPKKTKINGREKAPVGMTTSDATFTQKQSSNSNANKTSTKRGVVFEDSNNEQSDDDTEINGKQQGLHVKDQVRKPSTSKKTITPWKSLKRKQKKKPYTSKKKQKEIKLEKELAEIFNDGEMFGIKDDRWEVKEDDHQWWAFPYNDLGTHQDISISQENNVSSSDSSLVLKEGSVTSLGRQEKGASLPSYCEKKFSVSDLSNLKINIKNEVESYVEPGDPDFVLSNIPENTNKKEIDDTGIGTLNIPVNANKKEIDDPGIRTTDFNNDASFHDDDDDYDGGALDEDENSDEDNNEDNNTNNKVSETMPESENILTADFKNGFIRAKSRPNLVPQDETGKYVCTICHKKFARKPSVYGHKKLKHPEEFKLERQRKEQVIVGDYKCKYCPKHFKRLTSVYAHKQAFHYEEYLKEKEARMNKLVLKLDDDDVGKQKHAEGEQANVNISKDAGSVPRDSDGMFYCTVCNKKFKRNTSVYAHRRKFHPGVNFSVTKRNTDIGQKAFQCPYCPRSYAHMGGLTSHKAVEHKDQYQAEVIARDSARRKAIEARQMAKAQGMKDLIKKRISVKGAKYPHRRVTNRTGTIVSTLKRDEDNNYYCKFCDKKFLRKTSVLCHMKYTHPHECQDMKEKLNKCKKYKCPHCDHTFDYRYSIYEHVRQKHPEIRKARKEKILRDSEFLCKLCNDRPFGNYQQAFDHARNHHTDIHPRSDYIIQKSGPSLCPYCGMTFKYNTGLKSHIDNIHFQRKPFVCSMCGARYHTSSSLKKHELRHLGRAAMFYCDYCQKGFKDKYRLVQHEMRHRGEYKFYCEMCSAGFMQKFKLEDHILVEHSNSGEFPFKCDICGDGFKNRSRRHRHRKKFHKDFYKQRQMVFDASEYEETVCKDDGVNLSLKPIINYEPDPNNSANS